MKNRLHLLTMMTSLLLVLFLSACGQAGLGQSRHFTKHFNEAVVTGNDYVPKFLAQGGAKTDREVLNFAARQNGLRLKMLGLTRMPFGCSTIAAAGKNGQRYFGRNFDWRPAQGLVLIDRPSQGYASISTVCTSFLNKAAGRQLPLKVLRGIGLYAPIDGMNEKGVAVSVNMVDQPGRIQQKGSGLNLTTTTAIRVILDRAATTDQAIKLLRHANLHDSFGLNVHFAITDRRGRSVAAEYVDSKLHVTKTPILTNSYVMPAAYPGYGSDSSAVRFRQLRRSQRRHPIMSAGDVKQALEKTAASKTGQGDGQTQWSVVYDLKKLTARYYFQRDFKHGYLVKLG